ncbi:Sporulation/nuclear morphology [Lipomyces tetrasporus]
MKTSMTMPDPMDTIPSSPTQIYRNMLILEESLRSQYITLRVRRHKYTLFCALLVTWTVYFYYGVFIWYSVYAYVHLIHKLCLMIGVVTLSLFYLSGLYSKTMVFPRRFISNSNKGLRQFNLKLVSTHSSSSKALLAAATRALNIAFYRIWYRPQPPPPSHHAVSASSKTHSAQAHHNQTASHRRRSSSISSSSKPPLASKTAAARLPYYHYYYYHYKPPGGDVVKLVLLPKAFSAEFREGWEVYRQEYWERENDKRAARASGSVPCSCTYNDETNGSSSGNGK